MLIISTGFYSSTVGSIDFSLPCDLALFDGASNCDSYDKSIQCLRGQHLKNYVCEKVPIGKFISFL